MNQRPENGRLHPLEEFLTVIPVLTARPGPAPGVSASVFARSSLMLAAIGLRHLSWMKEVIVDPAEWPSVSVGPRKYLWAWSPGGGTSVNYFKQLPLRLKM